MFLNSFKGCGICQEAPNKNKRRHIYGHIRGRIDFTKHQKLMISWFEVSSRYQNRPSNMVFCPRSPHTPFLICANHVISQKKSEPRKLRLSPTCVPTMLFNDMFRSSSLPTTFSIFVLPNKIVGRFISQPRCSIFRFQRQVSMFVFSNNVSTFD